MAGPVYVALEGAEGCGKSTQAAHPRRPRSMPCSTRETGGTPIGERLRAILHDTTVTDLADRAEALITAADRAQHIAHVVRPALAAGRTVVSDRSVYSTLAYQGYGRGLDLDELRRHQRLGDRRAVARPRGPAGRPDRRCSPRRISGRDLDRFERAGDDFHERVAAGFRAMAAADPARWTVVDADGDVAEVAARVARRLGEWARHA